MRFLLRWAFRLFLLVLLAVAVVLLFKDALLRTWLEHRLRTQTGLGVKVGAFQLGVLSPTVTIEDLRLYNPGEFGGSLFVHIPELHVEYDPAALRARRLHLHLVRFHFAELNLVRNQDGKTNVVELLRRVPGGGKKSPPPIQVRPGIEFTGVDTLNLTLGRARWLDLQNPANNREVNLRVQNEILRNIKTEADLYGALLLVLVKYGANFVPTPLPTPAAATNAMPPAPRR